MTDLARELLEDISVNDQIRIVYGSGTNQFSAEGIVYKLSENFLTLKKTDGGAVKIRLDDDLRAIDILVQNAGTQPDAAASAVPAAPAIPSEWEAVPLTEHPEFTFVIDDQLEDLKAQLAQLENRELKRVLGGVDASFRDSLKNRKLQDKYHDLRRRLLQAVNDCGNETDYRLVQKYLGILACAAGRCEEAQKPFARSGSYGLASYAAEKAKDLRAAACFSLCAVLNGETAIDRHTADCCVLLNDSSALQELWEQNKGEDTVCALIAACAHAMLLAQKLPLPAGLTADTPAHEAARFLLDALPQGKGEAAACWKEFNSQTYQPTVPEDAEQPVYYTGEIVRYDPRAKYGSIESSMEPRLFFHINQVRDSAPEDLLLRRLLAAELGLGLEVQFCLGQNAKGPAADEVRLTDTGIQKADEAAEWAEHPHAPLNGVIVDYSPQHELGTIQCQEKEYQFRLDAVADPWLRAYCQESFSLKDPAVTFTLNGPYAADVCWRAPYPPERKDYQSSVTNADRQVWENFRLQQAQRQAPIVLPDGDPYAQTNPYQRLPDADAATFRELENDTFHQPSSIARLPQPETVAVMPGVFAEQARMAAKNGDLEKAAAFFARSVKEESFNDKVLMDIVTLAMRLGREKDTALPLLDTYKDQLPTEKRLDMQIQVYDKIKDYKTVAPLYEESIRQSFSLSKKSHYLNKLSDAYLKLGRYDKSLEACEQWEQLFRQNQYSSDAEKLRKMIVPFQRKKALCLYHLGRKAEAQSLVKDVLRANPSDVIALSILNDSLPAGTLNAVSPELFSSDAEAPFSPEEDANTELNGIVRSILDMTDLQVNKKLLPKIRDGLYCGSAEDGRKDAKALVSSLKSSGSAPKPRSDTLFAACKILDQLKPTEMETDKEIQQLLRTYAGRAMALRGDFLVTETCPIETVRAAYLFALHTLGSGEQDWTNAYNRYLKSFFLARTGGDGSLADYIAKQNRTDHNDGIRMDVLFAQNTIPEALGSEFLVGILQMIHALRDNKRVEEMLHSMYQQNHALRTLLVHELAAFLEERLPDTLAEKDFCTRFWKAAELLQQKNADLNQCISGLVRIATANAQSLTAAEVEKAAPDRWKKYLTDIDGKRLTRLYDALRRLFDYSNQSNDFENRADILSGIYSRVTELRQEIEKDPTDVSFEILRTQILLLLQQLHELQARLYTDFMPQLSWHEATSPFRNPNSDTVQLQLIAANERGHQAAKALRVTGVIIDGVGSRFESSVIALLRGGEEQELTLILHVGNNLLKNGSFSAEIQYSFCCRESAMGTDVEKTKTATPITVVLPDKNFEPFSDPFGSYIGRPMNDEKMFLGRDAQIRQITGMVHSKGSAAMSYGRAITLYGQTRTGKTSLMFHLKNAIKAQYGDKALIWDMGSIAASFSQKGCQLSDFLYLMLSKGKIAVRQNPILRQALQHSCPTNEILDHPERTLALFTDYMNELDEVMQANHMILVLFIDEFSYLHGYIKQGKLSENFMHFWKALLQNHCIFAIIAGQDDMPEFLREYPNDFACMELMKITYLDKESLIRLVREPMERENPGRNEERGIFAPTALERLYELTAGSAYLCILLCSNLVQYMNDRGVQYVTCGIIEDFLRTRVLGRDSFLHEDNFEPQLEERGHKEYTRINRAILLSVARHSQSDGQGAALKTIQEDVCGQFPEYTPEYVAYCTEHLVKDQNVLYKNGQKGYKIWVELLEKWLIEVEGE